MGYAANGCGAPSCMRCECWGGFHAAYPSGGANEVREKARVTAIKHGIRGIKVCRFVHEGVQE